MLTLIGVPLFLLFCAALCIVMAAGALDDAFRAVSQRAYHLIWGAVWLVLAAWISGVGVLGIVRRALEARGLW